MTLCKCCGFELDPEEQAFMLDDSGGDAEMCPSCNISQGTVAGQQA